MENVLLVWIETTADLRYERLKARKQKAGEEFKTREVFDAEECAETERQLDAVRVAARYEIENNATLKAFLERIKVIPSTSLAKNGIVCR